jgi:ribosomal protein S27E
VVPCRARPIGNRSDYRAKDPVLTGNFPLSAWCAFVSFDTKIHGRVAPLSALEPKSGVPVVCLAAKPAPIYRPRQPRQSPLYKTIERYLPEFERTYDRRYAKQYGPWRPIIGDVARRFLRCGDLHFGFARVRCPDCRHEMFVAFSCQQRCLCPSCHQKRTLLTAETIAQTICVPVPHRQLVFTIPKRLRIFCRHNRNLLGELARAARRATVEVYRQVLKRGDVIPGMIAGIQTFGELINYHPHVHAIATDGAFTSDGTFLCLPKVDKYSVRLHHSESDGNYFSRSGLLVHFGVVLFEIIIDHLLKLYRLNLVRCSHVGVATAARP